MINFDEEIARLQQQVAELQAKKDELDSLTPTQNLAIYMIMKMDIDQFRRFGFNTNMSWKLGPYKVWFDKAQKIMDYVAGFNIQDPSQQMLAGKGLVDLMKELQ